MQALPSVQAVPFAAAGLLHCPFAELQVPATWHWSAAMQTTGLAPTQAPLWHESTVVQRLPSLHAVPFAALGLLQSPLLGSQVPATWHWSDAAQTTGLAPTQAPAWHESTVVQALPSMQAVPFAALGLLQTPLLGSQVPATWHWSDAAQTTGLAPTQAPLWQESTVVQAFPSLQAAPLGRFVPTHWPVRTSQLLAVWHCAFGVQVTPAQGVSGVNAARVTGTPI